VPGYINITTGFCHSSSHSHPTYPTPLVTFPVHFSYHSQMSLFWMTSHVLCWFVQSRHEASDHSAASVYISTANMTNILPLGKHITVFQLTEVHAIIACTNTLNTAWSINCKAASTLAGSIKGSMVHKKTIFHLVWSHNSHVPVEVCQPLLWPPCVADVDIVFLPCGFFFFFLSSPNLNGRRVDLYHTSTHGVALLWIQNTGLKCAARGLLEIHNPKMMQKIAIWASSYNLVGPNLRN